MLHNISGDRYTLIIEYSNEYENFLEIQEQIVKIRFFNGRNSHATHIIIKNPSETIN